MRIVCNLLFSLTVLLWTRPAFATWLEAESPHFIVYSDGAEDDLRARVRLLEDFHSLLTALTGAKERSDANKLRFYLVRSSKELRKVRNVSDSTGGFYLATAEGTAAFAVRKEDGSGFGPGDIIFHEYAHHFMLQNFPANYPAWYIEGFAEYLATAEFTDSAIEVGRYNRNRASWLRANWLPLDRMLMSDSIPPRNDALFYAQSWLMVHYMMRDPERRAALEGYLRAFGAGEDPKATFRTAFGMDAVDFTRQLRNYGREMTFTSIPRASESEPLKITLRRLSPAADDLLLFTAGLSMGVVDWDSYPLLSRIKDAAKDHSNDPMALKALIRAELFYGDITAAESLLQELLRQSPDNLDALYLRGLAYIYAGRADPDNRVTHFGKARPWLARAHKADPNFYPALVRYAESYSSEPVYVSENVGNILILATQLAPQVRLIRLNAAQQQALHGDTDMAKALLAPIVNEPHSKHVREAARALMVNIETGQQPAMIFHVEAVEAED